MTGSSIVKLSSYLLFAATLLAPLQLKAEFDSSITSASMCDLRNMGNELARQGLIRENGTITNILSSNNIPVYCPIITSLYGLQGYNVGIIVLNPTSRTLRFTCVLSQYQQSNFRTRSITRATNVSPGFVSALTFFDLGVMPIGDRLDLRCEVPPGGAYGEISIF